MADTQAADQTQRGGRGGGDRGGRGFGRGGRGDRGGRGGRVGREGGREGGAPSEGGRGRGRGGRGGRGRRKEGEEEGGWTPLTKLGRLVKEKLIKQLEDIYLYSLPIKEYQIIDFFFRN